eukprot:gnl/MRDRNA2_/MRDRNA2_30222_c0_seq1.p1 gnl/MRDRNA2_/MRDRNA2_30222_c0~~gnl/MRDRNA2_/MRDRNA2_30222_c0_seq1.p1  ORF type:complete len:594 (+),score=109.14 gnl/MRDRNA2_/MRDRNA2_30222_c0_seq1:95-1876(+)
MPAMQTESPTQKRLKTSHGDATVKCHVDGKVLEHKEGTPVGEVLGLPSAGVADFVAVRMDNEVVPLIQPILGSSVELEKVPLASTDGIRTLVETLKFLLKIAKNAISPELAIVIGRPIGGAYYCFLSDKHTDKLQVPTPELLQKFQDHMLDIIKKGIPIRHMAVTTKEAVEQMSKTGAGFTAKMLTDCNVAQLEVVECCGMYHLPRAAIMPRADMVPTDSFKLTPYRDGFFLEHWRWDSKTGEAKHSPSSGLGNDILYNEYIERQKWARDVGLYTVAQLNESIRLGQSKKVIQAVEANCDRQFVELAAQIQKRPDVKLLLIAGPSSSGKTTFAMRLRVQLEALGYKPEVVSVDSFYKAWQDITSEGPQKVDWESLHSLNLEQLNDVLLTLMSGKEALIPEYDMKVSMPTDKSHWKTMKLSSTGKGLIIMEGIHCLNPALTSAVPKDQKFQIAIGPIPALQIDATHVLSGTTIRMLRRMIRDFLNRGRPVLATLRQWPSIAAGEVNNIYPHQINAQAVMNSEIGYEMSVLKVHVEPLLKQIPPTVKEYSEVRRLLKTLEQFIALPTNIIPPQSLIREFVGGSWYYDYGGWYKSY